MTGSFFRKFEDAKDRYTLFLTIAAMNSFLLSFKVVKYVTQIKALGFDRFNNTLSAALSQNVFFVIILSLLLSGFSVFYHIVFGAVDMNAGTIPDSFAALFYWMLGLFDLRDALKVSPFLATLFFCVFMVVFYFISLNIFLCTMLNTYSEKVGEEDVKKSKR